MPINRRPVLTQATPVVPLPISGSNTMSPGLLQLMMWSFANLSGKTAGCPVLLFLSAGISQTLYLAPNSFTFLPILAPFFCRSSPLAFCLCVPLTAVPAHLFFLSQIRFTLFGVPLLKINIYSKQAIYLFLCVKGLAFCQIMVSWRLKPQSINHNACLNDVPVSLPLMVASPITQTTTPPSAVTRYNSFAMALNFSKFHWSMFPLYVRRLSYGGDVTVRSMLPSGIPFISSRQSPCINSICINPPYTSVHPAQCQ